ncbi:ScbR family autoregulator-binding transcription factor [Streptomyces roseoverticillatus]|uniref:ScbR family autoregulator-binding transcription factor n=1 Tax=Streptomyces roseoverticillatus TaxID=66429 RepID=A0ABV3J291_9ACTN
MTTKQRKASVRATAELKQDRAVRTRAQTLHVAAQLFAQQGFRATSMQHIADRLGMTKGAVYFHFPTKETLAVAIVEEHYGRWPKVVKEVQAEGLSPMESAEEILKRAAVAFRDDPVMQAGARLQLERPHIDAELPTPYVDWTQLLQSLLVTAKYSGELREGVDPEAAARTLVSSFFGVQHISDVLSHRKDIAERWEETRKLLFFSLRA